MLFLSIKNYSQIAITSSYRGANDAFEKGELENFKKTTTVFVLPSLNTKEDYEKVLKEVWTITPYKVVEFKDFKILDYVDGSYSLANFFGDIVKSSNGTTFVHTNFAIRILEKEKFDKSFNKLKSDDKKYKEKLNNIFDANLSFVGRAPLCVNNKFLLDAMRASSDEKRSDLYVRMYNDSSFTNTNLGMLKNYLQSINKVLVKGEHCGLYDDFVTPEIKNLKESTLYIPEVYKMEYNPWKMNEKIREEKDIKKLLEDYKYKFQFIKDKELENKILNNENIYYLRYVSMNGNKYLQVVNAKTGDPVYYSYGGLSYNLKDDDFKKISKAVEVK